jgi:subtilisin family serine protease
LQQVPVGPAVQEENVRVYDLPDQDPLGVWQQLYPALIADPSVRRAGYVKNFSAQHVSAYTDEVLVEFLPDLPLAQVDAELQLFHLVRRRKLSWSGSNVFLCQSEFVPGFNPWDLHKIQEISSLILCLEISLAATAENAAKVTPGDYLFSKQQHAPLIRLEEAWAKLQNWGTDLTYGSEDVIIAILDQGLDDDHPDLSGPVGATPLEKIYTLFNFTEKVWDNHQGYSAIDGKPLATPDHGMGCAGIAAALADNPAGGMGGVLQGVVGAAPTCRLMGLIRPDFGTDLEWAEALLWAGGIDPGWPQSIAPLQPGADIISCSIMREASAQKCQLSVSRALKKLTDEGRQGRGTVVLFAAGEPGKDQEYYAWADHYRTIAVASSTLADDVDANSRQSEYLDVCAPTPVWTTAAVGGGDQPGYGGGTKDYLSNFEGTSAATPLTAGVVGLMLSANPYLSWSSVREILRSRAKKIGPSGLWKTKDGLDYSTRFGYGRIDACDAVQEALDRRPIIDIELILEQLKEWFWDLKIHLWNRGLAQTSEVILTVRRNKEMLLQKMIPRIGPQEGLILAHRLLLKGGLRKTLGQEASRLEKGGCLSFDVTYTSCEFCGEPIGKSKAELSKKG